MAFYSCNIYRVLIAFMLFLILWQIFRLLPEDPKTVISLTGIEELEDGTYNIHKKNKMKTGIEELEDDTYNIHKKDKVKVRVYYEALCPDSKFFFMKHLRPVTEKLSDFLDIYLIPYGKATTTEKNGQYFFKCQHGKEECFANKIHACAIEALSNMTLIVQFTECMILDNTDPDGALYRCCEQMKIDKKPIEDCALTERGSNLLKKFGDDTNMISPHFIPTIMINGSIDNQRAILKNFLLEICKLINMPLPPPCL